ncbi:hypothetical protein VNO77_10077 [Canavalia gladiata]|uniref:Uncharacterized protein n=1 Tax=Canavalia gladiata TaxID=3824 RepID=A0AAN9QXN2_CANGL
MSQVYAIAATQLNSQGPTSAALDKIDHRRERAAMAIRINPLTLSSAMPKIELRGGNSGTRSFCVNSQMIPQMRKEARGRRVWRRRRLIKKDEYLPYKMERVPFLEEQVRMIREQGQILTMDIDRLLLSEENRFDFVNEIAAEANSYVESNGDEYGGEKKAILHVLSNRMNDTGIYRPEAYFEPDIYKPAPHSLREGIS